MQTDPIGYEDQMNLSGYVGNDPVNMVDPTGTEKLIVYNNPDDRNFIKAAKNYPDRSGVLLVFGHASDITFEGSNASSLAQIIKDSGMWND